MNKMLNTEMEGAMKNVLKTQLNHYRQMIADAPDAETAIDILDGYDLIYCTHVIDEKFGNGATHKALYPNN